MEETSTLLIRLPWVLSSAFPFDVKEIDSSEYQQLNNADSAHLPDDAASFKAI